ncbi:hypothetical protein DERP_002498 [Dermatophagoides pteronyssinus]|uniref:Uncharacterized protein n=1 Tax=Dermatophagoides pteronyssinus TaxID=6956 RepID=A0ABQ8JID9_DERPT|nr:hypothetical protein DERP_002498 [Dermatophagoides pteronyssinus]
MCNNIRNIQPHGPIFGRQNRKKIDINSVMKEYSVIYGKDIDYHYTASEFDSKTNEQQSN